MNVNDLLLVLLLVIGISLWIAWRQKRRGYTFIKVFIGALIGMIGLSAMLLKLLN